MKNAKPVYLIYRYGRGFFGNGKTPITPIVQKHHLFKIVFIQLTPLRNFRRIAMIFRVFNINIAVFGIYKKPKRSSICFGRRFDVSWIVQKRFVNGLPVNMFFSPYKKYLIFTVVECLLGGADKISSPSDMQAYIASHTEGALFDTPKCF